MAAVSEEAAKRLMRREQFPAFYTGYGGKAYFSEYSVMPPFHKSIVEKGIDLGTVVSVFGKAMEESYMDMLQLVSRKLRSPDDAKELEAFMKRWESDMYAGDGYVSFAGFPCWRQLVIEKRKISPHGHDNYIMIRPWENGSYDVPVEFDFSEELADEYGFEDRGVHKATGRHSFDIYGKGWRTHNADPPLPVYYKNIIIALNNAAVVARYGGEGNVL